MVAIFAGAGAGLERGSASVLGKAGLLGSSSLGRGGEQLFLNAANGNLVINRQDEFLVGRGPDVAISRTYNSLVDTTDDNNDQWRQSTDRRIFGHVGSGGYNASGSLVKRVAADGSVVTYGYDSSYPNPVTSGSGVYISTEGPGAHDTLHYDATTDVWTWTDGATGHCERYSVSGSEWKLAEELELSGNTVTYGYTSGKLTSITTATASGTDHIDYSWDGNNITEIVTSYKDLVTSTTKTLTRIRYGYTSGKLTSVTVDLTPDDSTVSDGISYVTQYAYDATSGKVSSVIQTDGSKVEFLYTSAGGVYRVSEIRQYHTATEYRATVISYDTTNRVTTITAPGGAVTKLYYDSSDRLMRIEEPAPASGGDTAITAFSYNSNSDVTAVDRYPSAAAYASSAPSASIANGYDGRGNLLSTTDALGNVTSRTYGGRNELLTETTTGSDESHASNSHTTRYAYDSVGRQVFSVSADGDVVETAYNSYGQPWMTLEYVGQSFDLSSYSSTDPISAASLQSWRDALADPTQINHTQRAYDARGNIYQSIRWGAADGPVDVNTDEGIGFVSYVYDQAGQLLSRQRAGEGAETFLYDGLGRVTVQYAADGTHVTIVHQDSSRATVKIPIDTTACVEGVREISLFDRSGALEYFEHRRYVGGTPVTLDVATYAYDPAGRLRTLNASGDKTYYVYDDLGRVTGEIAGVAGTAPSGRLTEYRYDSEGRVIATTTYDTAITSSTTLAELADNGMPLTIADIRPSAAGGDRWSWRVYDVGGRLVEAIDGDGGVTAYAYDGSHRLIGTTAYKNKLNSTQLASIKATLPSSAVLPTSDSANDSVARNFYDRSGRLVGVLNGEGYLTRTFYDRAGRKIHEQALTVAAPSTLRAGGTLTQLYNSLATSPAREARWVYDGQGLLRFEIDGLNQVTEYVYRDGGSDAHGDVRTTIVYAGSIATPTSYTVASVRAALSSAGLGSDTDNRISHNVYDEAGRLAFAIDAAGGLTAYSYDNLGNLAKTVQHKTLTSFSALPALSALNTWVTGNAAADDRATRYYYGDDGRLRFTVDALGYATRLTYDAHGRKIGEVRWDSKLGDFPGFTLSDTTTIAQIETALNTYGSAFAETLWSYDALGQVATATDPTGVRTDYVYYANGDLKELIDAANTTDARTTRYVYDYAGRLIAEHLAYGTSAVAVTEYEYDGLGNLTRLIDPNEHETQRSYDREGRLVSETIAYGTGAAATTQYQHDALGEVVKTIDARGNTTRSYYNKLGQLTATIDAEGYVTETAYTVFGEVQSVTRRAIPVTPSMEIVQGVNTTVTPQSSGVFTIVKTAGANDYDAGAQSVEALSSDFVILIRPLQNNKYFLAGVSDDPTASLNFPNVDFGIEANQNGILYWVQGYSWGSTAASYAAGENIWLVRTGTTISCYKGATLQAAKNTAAIWSASNAGGTFYFASKVYSTGAAADVGFYAGGTVDLFATSADDATTSFEYDKLGRVTKSTDAENHYEQSWYDAFGNCTKLRNKLGGSQNISTIAAASLSATLSMRRSGTRPAAKSRASMKPIATFMMRVVTFGPAPRPMAWPSSERRHSPMTSSIG